MISESDILMLIIEASISRNVSVSGMDTLEAFVAALPKVELHVHLIGSAPVETVLALARRHPEVGVPATVKALREFYVFSDFAHFLNVYAVVGKLLRTPEDIAELVRGVGRNLAALQVRYVELQVSPYPFQGSGMSDAAISEALSIGARDVLAACGVRIGYIIDFPGHDAERDAWTAETVWEAVRFLHAERIGHGIRSLDDPALVSYLAEQQLPVEVSPTSNVCTRCVPSIGEHPLRKMISAGMNASLNSDDPPMFGTSLSNEYLVAGRDLGFSPAELAGLAANGVRASFLEQPAKEALLAEIAAVPLP